jgi:hypothetical protein
MTGRHRAEMGDVGNNVSEVEPSTDRYSGIRAARHEIANPAFPGFVGVIPEPLQIRHRYIS